MTTTEWAGPVSAVAGIVLDMATLMIGYGVLKGTVAALNARVSALEIALGAQLGSLGELKLQVARLEARFDGLIEQFKDLNAALRWNRGPARAGPEQGR